MIHLLTRGIFLMIITAARLSTKIIVIRTGIAICSITYHHTVNSYSVKNISDKRMDQIDSKSAASQIADPLFLFFIPFDLGYMVFEKQKKRTSPEKSCQCVVLIK